MSTLISSFFIDPVVRQARRFSGAVPNNEPADALQSHANPPASPSSCDEHSTSALEDSNAQLPAAPSPPLIDTFRRYTYFSRRPLSVGSALSVVSNGEADGQAAETVHGGNDGTSQGPSPLDLSHEQPPTSTIPIDTPSAMSRNPSRPTLDPPFEPLSSSSPATASTGDTIENQGGTNGDTAQRIGKASESLPADDGMRHLRARIQDIWSMQVSSEDKARLMHSLMTERYHSLRPQSPSSFISHDRPFTPTSGRSVFSEFPVSSPHSPLTELDPENPFNLQSGDTEPTYWVPPPNHDADHKGGEEEEVADDAPRAFGCQHYKRNVKVQCFECKRWYPCRHCHDATEAHNLDRKKTQNMLCQACCTPQRAAETCSSCGTEAAWYYCHICKLWDDDITKKIYHCVDCGICRVGAGLGKDYIHCKKCNVCIAIAVAETHKCIERAIDCDCPICGEYLFNSQSAVVSIRCGHYLHKACYNQYMETAYKCPICKKSAVTMDLQWRKLTEAIESQPMPEQFANTRAVIHCNDCSAKSSVKYHWLGNKCNVCDSYNTNELRILDGPESEQNADAFLSAESNRDGERSPTAVSPSQQPLASPRPYFRRAATEGAQDTWLPDQLPSFPFRMPEIPRMPQMPQMPRFPDIPQMPQFPQMPRLPENLQFPPLPQMPQVPDPYEVLERLRAFYPFRNYMNSAPGVDVAAPPEGQLEVGPADVQQPSLPQYVLERFSRSLSSPFRSYLNPPNDNIPDLDLTEQNESDSVGFWGVDGARFGLSGGEEEDEEEDDDSDSEDSAEDEEDDDADDAEDDDEIDFQLPGHR